MEAGYAEGLRQGALDGAAKARAEVAAQAEAIGATAIEQAARRAAEQAAERATASAEAAWRARLDAVERVLKSIEEQVQSRLEAAEDDVLALCLDVMAQTLGAASARPDDVRALVSHQLARVRAEGRSSVRLHPADLAALREAPDFDTWTAASAPSVRWIADAALSAGGCVVESSEGTLDARFDTVLAAFAKMAAEARSATQQRFASNEAAHPGTP